MHKWAVWKLLVVICAMMTSGAQAAIVSYNVSGMFTPTASEGVASAVTGSFQATLSDTPVGPFEQVDVFGLQLLFNPGTSLDDATFTTRTAIVDTANRSVLDIDWSGRGDAGLGFGPVDWLSVGGLVVFALGEGGELLGTARLNVDVAPVPLPGAAILIAPVLALVLRRGRR